MLSHQTKLLVADATAATVVVVVVVVVGGGRLLCHAIMISVQVAVAAGVTPCIISSSSAKL